MPPLSRTGYQGSGGVVAPLSANQMGMSALPGLTQSFTPMSAPRSAPIGTLDTSFIEKYGTSEKEGRKYADVGKMSLNLARPGAFADESVPHAKGLVEGFGLGAGRLLGGWVGQEQAGANIGQFLGQLGQIPLDVAGNALGAIPATVPFLPGGGIPGATLLSMSEEERTAELKERGWDGNPFSMFRIIGDVDREKFDDQLAKGDINPILAPFLRPAATLGEQAAQLLQVTGIPSQTLERHWAGSNGEAIKRVMNAPDDSLTEAVRGLRERYKNGELTDDQMLDQLVVNGAGYSNDWVSNLIFSGVLDPANLLLGAGTAIGLANKSAKAARAIQFVNEIGTDAAKALARGVSEDIVAKGGMLAQEAVTPYQVMQRAEQVGGYADQLAAATGRLGAHERLALSSGFARMEKVADISQRILDPFQNIGMRGTKPLQNAYISRESTKGLAMAHGMDNWSNLADGMDEIGLGDVFDKGAGYYASQEGLLMAGDSLKSDVEHIRRVSSAVPTDVATARARVGAENYAFSMQRWVSKRMADYGMLSGGTKEQALARAAKHAEDRLVRMGADPAAARRIVSKLDERGYALVDGVYFGQRIQKFNFAKKAAREVLKNKVQRAKNGEPTKAHIRVQALIDRVTLIGPRELTKARAERLRAALDAGDIEQVRADVRQYDRLAVNFLADATDEQLLINQVREWLDEHGSNLVEEMSEKSVKELGPSFADEATAMADDGYIYGMRPQDGDEWRITNHKDGPMEGQIKDSNPWIDIVGDAAEPWHLKFRADGGKVSSFANAIERKTRAISRIITSDMIDQMARKTFVERAVVRHDKAVEGKGTGLTVAEGRTLYQAVKDKAIEVETSPRGLGLKSFETIVASNEAASRVGMSGRDLMMHTLVAFEGNVGTVGLTQKLTGKMKTSGANIPLLPENALGLIAERMFPLVRFTLNPVFQMQEWVEPWVFTAARGRKAGLTGGWEVYDAATGTTRKVTLDDVDLVQQHMMDRYRVSNPETQFDMMERSLVYLHGQKAAKEAAAHMDVNALRSAIDRLSKQSAGERKRQAQSEAFRNFLGPMLKRQFDQINPNVWLDLEREFGTKDLGTIAVRWLTEKDKWASADPRVAYHLMDAAKEPAMGARAAVNLEENATVVFKSSREGLNTRVRAHLDDATDPTGLSRAEFEDTMRELGAHQDYIDRTWKVMQFEAKTGGVDQWWDDAVPLVAGGKEEVAAARILVKAAAEVQGITETELLSRTMAGSPVSLMHDDLISATEADLAAWGTLLQQQKDMVNYYSVDPVTGGVSVNPITHAEADARLLDIAANPPAFVPQEQIGRSADMQQVSFRDADGNGRTLWIPGGEEALRDLETPWTAWEAHLIRSQVINPNDLYAPALKHALDEKMWRGHTINMASTDPDAIAPLFNNYTFAMHSAQMTLTRNEMVATRFRVRNRAELGELAAESQSIRETLRRAGIDDDHPNLVNNLGLAYSTRPGVSHYIPLDARREHMTTLLPERLGIDPKTGKEVTLPATAQLVEQRAAIASGYLRGTTKEARARHATYDEGPLESWAIEQVTDAARTGTMDSLDPILKVKREASIKPEDLEALRKAANVLAEDPTDAAARAVVRKYTTAMKSADGEIIFKPWNVNGAGRTPGRNIDASEVFHGADNMDLYAYLKNDDVAWRGTATNANMGRTLLMAQDMYDNPGHYVRRRGVQYSKPVGHNAAGEDFELWKKNRAVRATYMEWVPIEFFDDLPPGNSVGAEHVAMLKGKIDERGFDVAIPLEYSQDGKTIHMTEGNHRLAAARELGMTAVPVEFHRYVGPGTERTRKAVPGIEPNEDGYVKGNLKPSEIGVPTVAEPAGVQKFVTPEGTWDAQGRYLGGGAGEVAPFEPARFGRDARGNATVPSQFKSEEGYVYRTANQSRAATNWKVGEYVAKHPATIYAESENSVVLRVRRDRMGWDEATGGVDASQNLRARGSVHAGDVEMLGADGLWHPVLDQVENAMEPLDEFGERISHRTNGLSLKTGFFGSDLGDPLNFPKGVHDLHMVGDLTEWMYHDIRLREGGQARWDDWLASLSSDKRKMIGEWIGKGAPRGAGVFKWGEAQGPAISFKPGTRDAAALDGATVAQKALYVRRRIEEAVAGPNADIGAEQQARLLRQYPTDEDLAELLGREVKVYGGDYKVYEDTMSLRKAEEEAKGGEYAEGLKRHGNGGYQWKLWDERRHIWDPETTAFASSHSTPRQSLRYYASSDDAHGLAGFYKNEGQPSVNEVGYSVLDPFNTIMPQRDGRVIRGATIMTDTGDRIIGLTQYRNRSTFLHEITHSVIEPLLTDPSLKRVVWDDMNVVIDERNASLVARTAELKTQVDEAAAVVAEHQNALVDAETRRVAAREQAVEASKALTAIENEAKRFGEAVPVQQGVLRQLKRDAGQKRKAAKAKKYPSEQARGLKAVDDALAREQSKLDDLVLRRDAALAKVDPATEQARLTREMHDSAKQDVDLISANLTQRRNEGRAVKAEYDKVATQMPEQRKYAWDREVSEHFADEFAKFLATGKAKNPKLRDAFAYWRKQLIAIFRWAKSDPRAKVSPEMEELFNDLLTPVQEERSLLANAVPFDATDEMMHAAGIQSVVDAEDAAFTNVQFRRKRSWLERSMNHPYFGIYPASYMWGKVAPEMIRALAVNPFGLPVPFLTKPVKINGVEYGLHGSPFAGFTNAMRVQNSVELQQTTDPEMAQSINDPKNQQMWRNIAMFLPATPWEVPANFPLWTRRIAEYGFEAQEAAAQGLEPPKMNVAKMGSEIASYAFGPKASFDWLDDIAQGLQAPVLGGEGEASKVTAQSLRIGPDGKVTMEQTLGNAAGQVEAAFMK